METLDWDASIGISRITPSTIDEFVIVVVVVVVCLF